MVQQVNRATAKGRGIISFRSCRVALCQTSIARYRFGAGQVYKLYVTVLASALANAFLEGEEGGRP